MMRLRMRHGARFWVWVGVAAVAVLPLDAKGFADEPGLVAEAPPASVRSVKTEKGYMIPYSATIPGTTVKFDMVPIPGGTVRLGSPAGEKGRKADEGPQVEVRVPPFWMARCETTWGEYRCWMDAINSFKAPDGKTAAELTPANQVDAVSSPSKLYDPTFTFSLGDEASLPAVTMSQFAARQYTKWLSKMTGHIYRLPCEAEWEHACRAGTTTAYHFGDDSAMLGEHEWFVGNSRDTTHAVGKKKPNPWGLYDMQGNVSEWVLDAYLKEGFARLEGKGPLPVAEAIAWPTKVSPRCIRGGSWELTAVECRAAVKMGSDDAEWTATDPNSPKSPWWFTDGPALSIGFRILRPLTTPEKKDLEKYWEPDNERTKFAVEQRVREGRGALGVVIPPPPMRKP